MYLARDVLMFLDIVCKNTNKIYEEFGLDLGYYCSTSHPVMDLILKISKEKKKNKCIKWMAMWRKWAMWR